MTREQRIAELQRQAEEGRARIAEREQAREDDPFKMQDFLMSEETTSSRDEVRTKSSAGEEFLIFKTVEGPPVSNIWTGDTGEPDWSGWERWLSGHLHNLRAEMSRGVAEATMLLIQRERAAGDRKLAELRAENVELKAVLADVLKRLDRLAVDVETARQVRAASTALTVRLVRLAGL